MSKKYMFEVLEHNVERETNKQLHEGPGRNHDWLTVYRRC